MNLTAVADEKILHLTHCQWALSFRLLKIDYTVKTELDADVSKLHIGWSCRLSSRCDSRTLLATLRHAKPC